MKNSNLRRERKKEWKIEKEKKLNDPNLVDSPIKINEISPLTIR